MTQYKHVIVELDVPPSANSLYVVSRQGRRIRTREYDRWRSHAIPTFKEGVERLSEPLASGKEQIRVIITANVDFRRDIDNLIKPIMDAARESCMIGDDRYCMAISIARRTFEKRLEKGRARVELFAP